MAMESKSIRNALLIKIFYFIGLALVSMFPAIALYLDIVVLGHGMPEVSVTEIAQELCVVVAILSALYCSRETTNRQKGFYELVAGFFLVVLIREFDMFLDDISHGFWKYPALIVFIVAVYRAYRAKGTVMQSMVNFMSSNAGHYVILGLVTVLFFSRLFGTSNLWEPLMGSNFLPIYKDAIQEGAELYGYLLIMVGSIMNFASFARENKSAA